MKSDSQLSTSINKMLHGLTPIAPESCGIFKLHPHLRNVNDKAYEPLLLAIGPYNHGKDGLKHMEEHKLQYLRQMILRRRENSVYRYIVALRQLEGSARNCYTKCISQTINGDQFVKMMLLDGCFIIELFRKLEDNKLRDERDPIFRMDWMLASIARDLLLFENQLPFFILTTLFEMTGSGEAISELVQLAYGFLSVPSLFQRTIKVPCNDSIDENTADATTYSSEEMKYKKAVKRLRKGDLKHLLDLMHTGISFSVFNMDKNHANVSQEARVIFKKLSETFIYKHLSGLIHKAVDPVFAKMKTMKTFCTRQNGDPNLPRYVENKNPFEGEKILDWTLIHCATELHEAGVKFQTAEQGKIFGIKFNNRVLEISPLTIGDNTETILRNLIAYEQYSQDKDSHHATDYMCFLDDLVNSPKDVEFLRQKGIIKNLLGDDKVTSTMVNKLGHNIYLPARPSIYAKITDDLKNHCSRRRNVWMAKLRHNYFQSPWSLLSFLAAILLLLLAITQTTFTIIK